MHEDLRRESAQAISEAGVDGIAIGGTLGRDKEEMREVLALTAPLLPEAAPKHLLGIGEVDDLLGGHRPRPRRLRLRRPDPPRPPRRRPRPEPGHPLPPRPPQGRLGGQTASPLVEGCPCPACRHHDRDYVSYLSRAEELTAVRLICLHNLTYMHQLTTHARAAIKASRFAEYAANVLSARAPWEAG